MARNIWVRGVRRKDVDADKLALAFLMLARVLHEQEPVGQDTTPSAARADQEAA